MTSKTFDQITEESERALASYDVSDLALAHGDLSSFDAAGLELLEKGTFAGLLIDVGAAVADRALIEKGRSMFEADREDFEDLLGISQLEYNLGNAAKELFTIARSDRNWRYCPSNMTDAYSAKSHYWRAFAAKPMPSQELLLTNLANCLNTCGRVVDALDYFDRCLRDAPLFGMAHLNRGLALQYLNTASGSYSVKLLFEMHRSFEIAGADDGLADNARAAAQLQQARVAQVLGELGHSPSEDPDDEDETKKEVAAHDKYWRWCLDQRLVLSEHSLYCHCAAARRDDLSVLSAAAVLSGELVPHMEVLTNRIKSEYCLARSLLFQAGEPDTALAWDLKPFEGTFTDLLDNESSGMAPELLRTAFRLCFGILDRIARGIAEFLKLPINGKLVYFHGFWRSLGDEAWDTLNSQDSANLVALHGLARDLSERAGGEWAHLRRYRNLFEHELCLVTNETGQRAPWLPSSIEELPLEVLSSHANDMLRFTRAAIYHFVFLVREKSRPKDLPSPLAPKVTFDKKPIGKS